jgi:hypothetical protein
MGTKFVTLTTFLKTWIGLLYLKPTHALILKHTFTSTFIKTLKLVKNVFVKATLKNPTCFFGHYCMTILSGCPLYLVHLPVFRCLLCHLPFWYVAVCRLCICVSGVPVCGLSGHVF